MAKHKPKPPRVGADLFGGEGEPQEPLGADLSPAEVETTNGAGSEPGAAEGGAGAEGSGRSGVCVEAAGDPVPTHYDDYRVWLHDPTAREPTAAALEVLGFPAALLTKLPVPWVLHCAHRRRRGPAHGVRFRVTNSRASYTEAREAGVPVFAGGEWWALAHAAQNDRVWPHEFATMLSRKASSGVWRLTHAAAFGGLGADALIAHAVELTWTVGDVFRRIGATIERVEVRG